MRMYSALFNNVAVSAAQDIFEIVAPSTAMVVVHSCFLGQVTDYGDAASEGLRVQFIRGHTGSGSGGSTVTPVRLGGNNYPTAASTVEANNTTPASGGSPDTVFIDVFNIQVGWQYIPPPEQRIYVRPSERLVLNLPTAPADAITMSGTLIFEEI